MRTSSAAYEDYWCPAGEGSDMLGASPISADEWIALLKISSGDWSVPSSELACLLERKLIEITAGFVHLTQQGYVALGIPV
ncbi:MAG TPA: hypothetical protein VD867_13610 [Burkholderiales bacterium]|nr:hypothetical protein [Burkholderiales bacterium]